MITNRLARGWFALTALAVIVGIIVQLKVTSDPNPAAFFQTTWKRELNVLCFFTILSNIAVGIGNTVLALGRVPAATWFRAIRLIGLIGITLTFVVFQLVLRQLQDLTGQAAFADFLLHTASPILCVAGWLWFGPRGQTSKVAVWISLGFLLVWGVFTLIRGHVIGFYPYAFMNPNDSGYVRVAVNLAIIGAVFVGLAAGAHALDAKLKDRTT